MKKVIVLALAFLVALVIVAPGTRDSVEGVMVSSSNVALVPGPCGAFSGAGCMPTSGFSGGFAPSFTNVATSSLPNVINDYDTVVLLQICDIGTWLGDSTWRDALHNWIQAGGKLIIYDSDACGTLTLDYSNFVFPFTTNNPCQCGSNEGTLEIVEENTLSSTDPTSPYYIDVAPIEQNTDAVGDASVMLTQDSHWKGDMKAKNVLGFEGFTHTYAEYGSGLIIYNGLDSDYLPNSGTDLEKIWELELKQQWDPSNLPGSVCVAGCERKVIILQGIDSEASCEDGDGFDQRRNNIRDAVLSKQDNYAATVYSADDFLEFSYGDQGACGSDFQQAAYSKSDTCIGLAAAANKLDTMIAGLPAGTVVDVVGHSMGGMVAAYWASTKSRDFLDTRVHSIITLDSPVRGALRRHNVQQWLALFGILGPSACAEGSPSWRDITERSNTVATFTNTANSTEREAFAGLNCTPVGDVLPGYWRTFRRITANDHGCAFTRPDALSEIATILFITLIDDQGAPTAGSLEPSPSYTSAWLTEFSSDPIKRRVTLTRSVGRGIDADFTGGEISLVYRGPALTGLAPNIRVIVDGEVVLASFDTDCRAGCRRTLKTGLGSGIHHVKIEIVEAGTKSDFRFDAFEVMPVRN